MSDMRILTNCKLCGTEQSLHLMGSQAGGLMQCLNCGYASANKFMGKKEDSQAYNDLPEDMKKMSKEMDNRVWIPSVMTLPMGAINPILVDGNMFWAFAPLVKIEEDEIKDYVGEDGVTYDGRYDHSKTKLFSNFFEALKELNDSYEQKPEQKDIKIDLSNVK